MGLVILIPLVLAPIFIFIAVSRISNINNAPVVTYDVGGAAETMGELIESYFFR